jgi:predicted Zn-dependent protease
VRPERGCRAQGRVDEGPPAWKPRRATAIGALLEPRGGVREADARPPRASRESESRQLPAHPWALALAGHARVLEGRPAEVEALLQRALDAARRRPRVWLRLAQGFEAAGRAELAGRCRAEAAGTAPRR